MKQFFSWLAIPILLLSSPLLNAATFPTGFTGTQIATGLSNPTAMAFAPDGRLFVCKQGGSLRVIKNNALLSKPFLNVTVDSSGERGLLGVTFDPNFSANQFVYIYYTAPTPVVHNRITRFTADGDTAITGSDTVLLDLNNLSATNHNGGAIHFGPDGKLYAGVGENANGGNAQSLNNLLGKILRINSDGTIPSDNPSSFPGIAGSPSGVNRAIWAVGLRNPFTFAFQPGSTRMFVNDVGQNTWEEINDGIAGSNYGWPATEGFTTNPDYRGPLSRYGHGGSDTTGCAIVGGAFYNPTTVLYPVSYVGDYFFADLCSGWIRVFHPADSTSRAFGAGASTLVDLQVSTDGKLYYLQRGGGGQVFRVDYADPLPIQLGSFTGTVVEGGNVKLTWTTISEINNYGFYVQRKRPDGQAFVELPNSFVPGHGTTNEPRTYTFTDVTPGIGAWMYRLKQVDLNGDTYYSDPISVDVVTGTVENDAPLVFELAQNYPNPFNPTTHVRYQISEVSLVTLKVYDVVGREVRTLVNERLQPGRYETTFDASALAGGVYLYRLQAVSAQRVVDDPTRQAGRWVMQTKKLVLLR